MDTNKFGRCCNVYSFYIKLVIDNNLGTVLFFWFIYDNISEKLRAYTSQGTKINK